MAEQEKQQLLQQRHPTEGMKSLLPDKGPSGPQVLAVVTMLPVGAILLILAGLTFAGTLTGLALATPVFVLFSPVLVPAAITIGLAVTGFLASGAFGVTALTSLSWVVNCVRQGRPVTEQVEHAKRRMGEAAGQVGQVGHRAKEAAGQGIQRAQEAGGHEQRRS